ncbi:hypothetical protein ACFYWX_44570 [Streptomyces sp. NPDC002888]|uniref:hypothetical protein n=1 Tax=Streptomyces sp. NPDC002888 TaxID=3364668 RepID=UPI00368270FC
MLGWAAKLGAVRRAGVEGTGPFGAGLPRYLLAQHVQVYEVNRPDRTARRLLGKSDPLDAQAAARAVLSGRAQARAKTGDGPVHSARMFKLAKTPRSRPVPRRSTSSKPSWSSPTPLCGNDCPAWATASCSALAHASAYATAGDEIGVIERGGDRRRGVGNLHLGSALLIVRAGSLKNSHHRRSQGTSSFLQGR